MSFSKIEYDINQFHPSLRIEIESEIQRIMRVTPPFHSNVKIVVSGRIDEDENDGPCKNCGKDHTNQLLNAYAVTDNHFDAKNSVKDNSIIYFNEKLFGINGDMKKLAFGLANDKDHGGLSKCPHHVLTHEYGHVVDAMIGQVFGRDSESLPGSPAPNVVVEKYEEMFNYAFDQFSSADKLAMVLGLNMSLVHEFDPDTDQMVSLYAYTNRNEMFAETFASYYVGDERQKGLKITGMMGDMVETMYKVINDQT